MLTPQLAMIKKRLEASKRYNVDGSEPLYQELLVLERHLDVVQAKTPKTLTEGYVIECCNAMTSGPGEYCSCCGKAI
jgi:hypothetical protein